MKVKTDSLIKKDIIMDENGSALILSMLMVMMLTLVGIAATTTSTLEMGIAANERVYKDNFNRAEAASMIGAQEMENETDETPLKDLQQKKYSTWLHFDLPYPGNLNDNWDY
jgi:Tfp pilus assembly protein PilX